MRNKGSYKYPYVDLSEFSKMEDRDNWEIYRYNHYQRSKSSAKTRKIEFTLTVDDFVYPEFCPILGIKITRKLTRDYVPTLDRVDCNKGYTQENVRMVSHRANRLKTNNSIETLERLLEYMKGNI